MPALPFAQWVHSMAVAPPRLAVLADRVELGVGVRREAVDADDGRDAKAGDVVEVAAEVGEAGCHCFHVLGAKLAEGDPAVHLQGADGRDDHPRVRPQALPSGT